MDVIIKRKIRKKILALFFASTRLKRCFEGHNTTDKSMVGTSMLLCDNKLRNGPFFETSFFVSGKLKYKCAKCYAKYLLLLLLFYIFICIFKIKVVF